jgi:hypothetical protein
MPFGRQAGPSRTGLPVKCIASHLGDCSRGLSREHFISESVLRLVGTSVRVSGFPWQQPGQAQEIGVGSLTSKILCTRHNEALSPLDSAAKDFLAPLKAVFDQAIGEGHFADEDFPIQADRLELWLLKVLCGLLAVSRKYPVPRSWTELLFETRQFTADQGLHIFGESGPASWYFNLLRVISVGGKANGIAGAKFGLGGLAFLLALGTPRFSDSNVQSIHRPETILIHKGPNTKRFQLSWGPYKGAGSVFLRIEGVVGPEDTSANPIVRPRFP